MSIFTSSAGSSIIQDYKSNPPSFLLLISQQSSQSLCQKYKPYYMPQRRQTQNTHQQTPDPQLLQISRELDIEYLELRDHIAASSYFGTASKHLRIRLDNWLSKLDTIIANITWKRNRNNYAKLIDLMCECETVVEPFTALPPQGDVPKMNRHQINRIIDEVERQVKLEKMQSRGSEEVNMVRSSRVKPNQFWSRVKSQREFGTKGSFLSDQSSMFMGKSEQNGDFRDGNKKVDLSFNHISQSSKQSDKKKYQFSSEDAISNSSKDKQNLIEPNKFYITNNSHEQIHQNRPKPFQKAPKHLSVKLNTQLHKVQLIRSPLFEASVPQQKVKYTESLNTDNFSDKNSRLQAFRDQHISFDYENQTLKTQYLDQDISLNPQRIQDLSFFSADQCDFSDQLSERCRYKQGVLSQQYFGWRKNQRELLQDYKANLERAGPKESQLAHVPRKLMVKASAFKIVPTNHLNPQFQNSYQQQFLDEPDEIFNGTNSFSIISDHQFQEQVFPNKTNERQIDNVNSIA